MKRKLTLAIGCLAAAMPNLSNANTPARSANVAQAELALTRRPAVVR